MATHPFFGTYETQPDDTSCDFAPIVIDNVEVEPMLLELGPKVTLELIDQFAAFCKELEAHVATVRDRMLHLHEDLVVPLVSDLVESNPDLDVLDELFPGERDLVSVAQLTPEMVTRATAVTSCMTNTDPDDGTVTLDLTFLAPDMNYLFAHRFDLDGQYLETNVES